MSIYIGREREACGGVIRRKGLSGQGLPRGAGARVIGRHRACRRASGRARGGSAPRRQFARWQRRPRSRVRSITKITTAATATARALPARHCGLRISACVRRPLGPRSGTSRWGGLPCRGVLSRRPVTASLPAKPEAPSEAGSSQRSRKRRHFGRRKNAYNRECHTLGGCIQRKSHPEVLVITIVNREGVVKEGPDGPPQTHTNCTQANSRKATQATHSAGFAHNPGSP